LSSRSHRLQLAAGHRRLDLGRGPIQSPSCLLHKEDRRARPDLDEPRDPDIGFPMALRALLSGDLLLIDISALGDPRQLAKLGDPGSITVRLVHRLRVTVEISRGRSSW
jgi:hypothetical protein